MSRDSITISPDAVTHIVSNLGNDHATSRNEIEKLALLTGPGSSLTYDDVNEALGDSALLAVTDVAIAAAEGQMSRLQLALSRCPWTENLNSIMLIQGCQGYFRQLLTVQRASGRGSTPQQAVKSLRPPVHFKLQDRLVARVKSSWSETALNDAVNRLQDAELTLKTGMNNDQTYCAQTLLGLCMRAQTMRRWSCGPWRPGQSKQSIERLIEYRRIQYFSVNAELLNDRIKLFKTAKLHRQATALPSGHSSMDTRIPRRS